MEDGDEPEKRSCTLLVKVVPDKPKKPERRENPLRLVSSNDKPERKDEPRE